MSKTLVIVESPAKAKTITKFLGDSYIVTASRGHIRDLPKNKVGVTIDNGDVIPTYQITDDHKMVVNQLVKFCKEAKGQVYLATDEDREGEAISWHICQALGLDPASTPRIVFHEITKSAIQHAIEHPRQLDMLAVDAQQARRILDRVVGYTLSPLLSTKIQRGLSAGRVQSAALKIVVDREKEIRAFVPTVYYTIPAIFIRDIEGKLVEVEGKKIDAKLPFTTKQEADRVFQLASSKTYQVDHIEDKETYTKALPPFMTSTLQQTASTKIGYSPDKTMKLAQKLYEGVQTPNGQMGVITYMRTDSLNLAKEAVDKCRSFIEQIYGKEYLPNTANTYTSKAKGAQEAHEAIRPTNVEFTPEIAQRYLEEDELKLYTLIWNRYVACQMVPCKASVQNIYVKNEHKVVYKLSGRKILFDGYTRVWNNDDSKDKILPTLSLGNSTELIKIDLQKKSTEPPARYNEASLVKKLEDLGIGRPSTYASIIALLKTRKYVELNGKALVPTEVSFKIIDLLENYFPDIVDSNFTAHYETKLDEVAEGKINWKQVLLDFYQPFMDKIQLGRQNIPSQKNNEIEETNEECPRCKKHKLIIRTGRYGKFKACSGFPRCKYIEKTTKPVNENEEPKPQPNSTGIKCPKCKKGEIVERIGKRGSFYACNNFPKCKNIVKDISTLQANPIN